jgi:nucleotide-binding universal stress UspA family protein
MHTLGPVIVGVDYSPASAAALSQGIRVAAFGQSTVRPVHVIETLVVIDITAPLVPMVAEATEDLIRISKERWPVFAARVPGAEKLQVEVEVNSTVAALSRRVDEVKAGLLVLGAEGLTKSKGVGPVASGCVRRANTDVLLVQPTHSGAFTTVVVAVDFSPTSRRALEQGVRMATQDGAGLHVVHAYTSPWGHKLNMPGADVPELERTLRGAMEQRLREFAAPLAHEMGYLKPVYTLVQHDTAAHGIGQYAKQVGADLVIMGKRGQSNLRDLFLGSTAERLLKVAPCSVMAVRPA